MSHASPLIHAGNLQVTRGGVNVLNIADFYLNEKEVLALIGPNGSGKSSFLLTLASLIPFSSGQLFCRGEEISGQRSAFNYRRRTAMVFQQPLLFEGTVEANVAAGLKIRGFSASAVKSRVMESLELFRIEHLAKRSASKISGGEAQRTSLARAFAVKPELIFLDEPFAALDPPTRLSLMEDLVHILKETSTAALFATHDQLEAVRMADRMVVMNNGEIVQSGSPTTVMNCPANEFVAYFVGMENLLTGVVVDEGAGFSVTRIDGQHIEMSGNARTGDHTVFCIRPEHITIDISDPHGGTSARNVFPAAITRIIPAGSIQKVYLDCGFKLVAYLTNQSLTNLQLLPGKQVFASFKATAVHLIRSG